MKHQKNVGRLALTVLGIAAASLSHAAPTTFFGQDPNASLAVPQNSLSVASRNEFVSKLKPGYVSEGFESFATGNAASRSLFGGAATLTGSGAVQSQKCDPFDPTDCPGRFNTTGSPTPPNGTSPDGKWWESAGAFTITFNNGPVSAFGLFGTDFADFGGKLTMDLMRNGSLASTLELTVDTTNTPNGSLLFFGFTDAQQGYDSIVFHVNQGAARDWLGFDDLLIGELPTATNPTPEPGSVALVGLGLGALAWSRRKQRK